MSNEEKIKALQALQEQMKTWTDEEWLLFEEEVKKQVLTQIHD